MAKKNDWLEFLWSTWIKAEAGFKSEMSGGTETLCAHHLAGKGNTTLIYFTKENGMCLTSGEHNWKAHGNQTEKTRFNEWVKTRRGETFFSDMLQIKRKINKIPDSIIENFLLQQLAPRVEAIADYFQSKDYKNKQIISYYNALFKKLSEGETS